MFFTCEAIYYLCRVCAYPVLTVTIQAGHPARTAQVKKPYNFKITVGCRQIGIL